jgi:hypothetical protein
MYKVTNINDLELIYSILREDFPNKQIDITFNYNTKEYIVKVSDKEYKHDPEVPVDVNIEIVYGDSVTYDTPILLRDPITKLITVKSINSIVLENEWTDYPEFKIFDKSLRLNKQFAYTNYEVWSDNGWNPIKKIIRHKTNKKIYRISTQTGIVDVTEDHSLYTTNLEKIKPENLNPGDTILHNFPKNFINCNPIRDYLSTKSNDDFESLLLSDDSSILLNCSKELKEKFCKTYFKFNKFTCDSKLKCMKLYYLLRNLGYDVNVNSYNDSQKDIYNLQLTIQDPLKEYQIKKVTFLRNTDENEFVYDLETEYGKYHAGIGQIIVANTDSIFAKIKFNRDDFNKNRIDTFKLADLCGEKLTNEIFNRPPIVMEFEKVFQPFILLTKKRYIANKFENMKDPFQLKGVDAKGIALTRRDYCKMVKKCYQEIIDTIMNNKISNEENSSDPIISSIKVYKKFIDDIKNYNINIDDLVISAMLAKEYSCKMCKKKSEWILKCEKCKLQNSQKSNICQKCKTPVNCAHSFSLAHINLAQELLKRNEEVSVGDRIAYIFIETDDFKIQKNELAEDPKYAIQNNLKFNRSCYLEQLAKPILGFYKIVLKDKIDLLDDIIDYTNKTLVGFGAKPLKPSDFKIEE